ncbi:MAG: TonB-dependent receptor [Dysgonamonadaceae bacterium]|jgi:outer membrane receptor protein involved in Fe transport|nr:TonB-dependent receptor [Dysgonamonadaceae bacterium]
MKRITFIAAFLIAVSNFTGIAGNNEDKEKMETDTVKGYALNEIVITTSSKETNSLKKLPGSTTIISPLQIDGMQINDISDVSNIVPNFYIPDYGSKYSSPVYIRGIGNRSTGQASGMYVDNVPMLNKSTYDFDFEDVQRIELLRGPQGTLYGRNAMGGIMNVFTSSPLDLQQTKIGITGGNHGIFKANAVNRSRINECFGISIGGYYDRNDGYFTNEYTGEKADALESAGGRLRMDYLFSNRFKGSLIVDYDFSDQGAYPYHPYDRTTGEISPINYNDPGSYLRRMGYTALNLEYTGNQYLLTSTTSYQGLNDLMHMDQDQTPAPVYNIRQNQKLNAFTEEINIKSKSDRHYQWSFGSFGFYNDLKTNVDVNFGAAGMGMIQGLLSNAAKAGAPAYIVNGTSLPLADKLETPSYGIAVFHQSTYNRLFVEGLSVTAGIRLDYVKDELTYGSHIEIPVMKPGNPPVATSLDTTLSGTLTSDYIQILPKLALKYELDKKNYVYASISKGYNPGGFNIQSYSELELSIPIMSGIPNYPPVDMQAMTEYKPEYSWNYEVGFKGELIKNILSAELALFYIHIDDMQLIKINQAGRTISNVGKSKNKGFDVTLRANVTHELILGANYGYTEAKFDNYIKSSTADYSGNYVPYAPRQTYSLYGTYIKMLDGKFIDRLSFHTQYNGAGKIYWTEANDIEQGFYGLLNVKAGITKGICTLNLWTKNALNQDYSTFYFEMNGKGYLQQGKPVTFGADLTLTF